MGLIETTVAVLVGNLFAAWFLYGLHTMTMRGEAMSTRLIIGGAYMAMPTVIVLGGAAVGDYDQFAFINAAAFLAAIVGVLCCWGLYTIAKHEKRGDISTAPVKAWIAVLAPFAVSIAFLWRYAPIG